MHGGEEEEMRRYCLIAIGCLALLTACGVRQAEMPAETVVSSEADAAGGDGSLENGAASDCLLCTSDAADEL